MSDIRPKISFGLTCYNQREYIGVALDSIKRMKLDFPYEVIIADDGSTDGSLEVIESYREFFGDRLVVLTGRSNRYANEGYSSRVARNKGRLGCAAWGEYCLFGDGDDYWTNDTFVKEAIDILDSDKELVAVFHRHEKLSHDGVIQQVPVSLSPGYASRYLYITSDYCHYGTFVFRNLILQNPDQYLQQGYDDWPLQLWLCCKGRLFFRDISVYSWRQFENRGWETIPRNMASLGVLNALMKRWRWQPLWVTLAELDRWKWRIKDCIVNFGWIKSYISGGKDRDMPQHRIVKYFSNAFLPTIPLGVRVVSQCLLIILLLSMLMCGVFLAVARKMFINKLIAKTSCRR